MPSRSRAGAMRHVVRVMRPTAHGEANSPTSTVLYTNVPCSIETTSGREAERMFQMYATSTYKVSFYGDPARRLNSRDWLDFQGRRFNILQVNDLQQNGVMIELICSEGEGL